MTEDEAKQIMRASGKWSYLRRQRRDRHWYVYAARHVKGRREERYICPLAELESLTAEDLKQKLS